MRGWGDVNINHNVESYIKGCRGTLQRSYSSITILKFSFQLANFLYQYIKKRQLWNPYQPTVIHCDKDPLGRVLALNLLLKNTFPVNSRKRKNSENKMVLFSLMLIFKIGMEVYKAPRRKYYMPSNDTQTFQINNKGHLQCHQDPNLIHLLGAI